MTRIQMPTGQTFYFDASELELKAAAGAESNVVPFEMVAYSGGKLHVSGFPHPVIVDMRGVEVKASADGRLPITLDHKDDRRVGHADAVNVDVRASRITMTGTTSSESEWRDEVVASHKNGFRWQASIEGRTRDKEVIRAGRKVRVNGQTFTGPVIVARKFVLRAVSFVSAGGDEENSVRLAASKGEEQMDSKYAAWLEELGLSEDQTTDKLEAKYKAELEAKKKADSEPEPKPDDEPKNVAKKLEDEWEANLKAMREKQADEMERQAKIREVCKDETEIAASAIREGWSVEKTELEVLRKTREEGTPAIHVSDKAADVNTDVLAASLCRSAGYDVEGLGYSEKTCGLMDKYSSKGYGLHALMHDTLRAAGERYQPGVYDNDFIRATYKAEQKLQANQGFSTISLTGALSDSANKVLLNAYKTAPSTARLIAGTRPANTFHQLKAYRITGAGDLLPLGPGGELVHTEIGEAEFTNRIKTMGRMVALTREMQINDDLGAFMRIPQLFGRAAARTEDKLGWTALLAAIAGGTFFSAGNGNLGSGVLADASLTSLKQLLAEQTDGSTTSNNFLNLQGKYLVVPPALQDPAERLMRQREFAATGDTDALVTTVNTHQGSYEVISSPYFGAAGNLAGSSDTHFAIVVDPMDVAVLEFAHLTGQQNPVFESGEADFNVLGVQWRIYRDFGWAVQDPRGAVYSPGT